MSNSALDPGANTKKRKGFDGDPAALAAREILANWPKRQPDPEPEQRNDEEVWAWPTTK